MNEDELLGLKILALLYTGVIDNTDEDIDLSMQVGSKLAEEFNYEIDGLVTDWIPQALLYFFDKFIFLKEFPNTITSYELTNHRFWESYKYMNSLINKLEVMKLKRPPTKG